MARLKKFSQFEHGFLAAISCVVRGHGCNTEVYEMWACIGEPSSEEAKKRGADDYDVETIKIMEGREK